MARLLQCTSCSTLERLPDYDGPKDHRGVPPEGADVLLEHVLMKHKFPDGTEHIGNLFAIPDELYERMDVRRQFEKDVLKEQAGIAATLNTFEEDALVCFNKHHRPEEGCPDYKTESKRLGNPTKQGWEARKVVVYACQFCPAHSWHKTEERRKEGMYK